MRTAPDRVTENANADYSRATNIRGSVKSGCESTIESSQRRGFIRKAAMAAAAVGVGTALLGKSLAPESSAVSPLTTQDCFIVANYDLSTDNNRGNNGTCLYPGLSFGGLGSGEGIASNRNCSGSIPYYTLDFYTGGSKRMTITNSGQVSIGNPPVPLPGTQLCVHGVVSAWCSFNANITNGGGGLTGGITFGGSSGEGISSDRGPTSPDQNGLDLYTAFNKRVSITNAGKVGVNNTGPTAQLHVNGTFCGAITGYCCTNFGVLGSSIYGVGVKAFSECSVAVCASSLFSPGVQAQSYQPVVGKFKNNSPFTDRTAQVQFETGDTTAIDWNIGVAGSGNSLALADGDFFIQQVVGGPRMVIGTTGNVGIGTITPKTLLEVAGSASVTKKLGVGTTSAKTTLDVNGSMSAKIVSKSANYTMASTDFGVLASAASSSITITLPAASTALGMMVFIKRTDNKSANVVNVAGAGSDTIEGSSPKLLSSQYASLTLVSNGKSPGIWYIISNAT